MPALEFTAPWIGLFKIVCGILMIAGLLTRSVAIPLIVIMLFAICTPKFPLLVHKGFWAMAQVARTDWSMLLGSIVLLVMGAGLWPIDDYWELHPAG